MKITKAVRKNEKIIAYVETDEPMFQDLNLETKEVIKSSKEKIVKIVEVNDLHDDDLNKESILKELEKKEEIIFENVELKAEEIKEKAKAKKGIREW
ncbi:hypothetical protein K9M74_02675 [Candidatus Woesearchaeota archaeon]|nr:hypothetical protein [Candidatus Woesearchaeota archaeon]